MKFRLIQISSGVNPNDAITFDIYKINEIFQSKSAKDFISSSLVYAHHISKIESIKVLPIDSYCSTKQDILIIHYSTALDILPYLNKWEGPKILIYHNITPSHYFEKWNMKIAGNQIRARYELYKMSCYFDLTLADSEFNAHELRELGFANVKVRPVAIPDFSFPEPLRIARKKIMMFVGRFVPNKGYHHLIKAFYYFNKIQPGYQLSLVGSVQNDFINYYKYIQKLVKKLNLSDQIIFHHDLPVSELQQLYAHSDLFVSMSEHEGFCVPLMEAMQFNLPIIALTSPDCAIAETMGASGFQFSKSVAIPNQARWSATHYLHAAAHWKLVLHDERLYDQLVHSQKERWRKFQQANSQHKILNEIRKVINVGIA